MATKTTLQRPSHQQAGVVSSIHRTAGQQAAGPNSHCTVGRHSQAGMRHANTRTMTRPAVRNAGRTNSRCGQMQQQRQGIMHGGPVAAPAMARASGVMQSNEVPRALLHPHHRLMGQAQRRDRYSAEAVGQASGRGQ